MARPSVSVTVQRKIEQLIRDGSLKPGESIPTEAELCLQMGAGRSSIREALKVLERKGLIDVQPGRGRLVSELSNGWIESPITNFRSVTELLASSGYVTVCKVLSSDIGKANKNEREVLGLEDGATVVRLERTHFIKNIPIVCMLESVPTELLGGENITEDWSKSLVGILSKRGHKPVASRATVKAVTLPKEMRAKLPAQKNTDEDAWIEIMEANLDPSGRICLLSKVFLKGDMFSFSFIRTDDN